jgi:hypothetical protein
MSAQDQPLDRAATLPFPISKVKPIRLTAMSYYSVQSPSFRISAVAAVAVQLCL